MTEPKDDQIYANAFWTNLVVKYEKTGKISKPDLLEALNLKKDIPAFASELLILALTEKIFEKRPATFSKFEAIQIGARVKFYTLHYEKKPKSLSLGYTPQEQAKERVAESYRITTRTVENILAKYKTEIELMFEVILSKNLSPPDYNEK